MVVVEDKNLAATVAVAAVGRGSKLPLLSGFEGGNSGGGGGCSNDGNSSKRSQPYPSQGSEGAGKKQQLSERQQRGHLRTCAAMHGSRQMARRR